MGDQVSLVAAFGAGILSFISPCVLPLIPGYLSFVSGLSLEDMRDGAASSGSRRRVLVTAFAFVVGFSLVFIALGASATAIGRFVFERLPTLEKIAGAVIVVFGLHMMGLFRIGLLEREKRVHSQRKPAGVLGALLVGVAFALGWTPCIGPILGGILAIAASKETLGAGVVLLGTYSAGLAVPFMLTAIAMNRFFTFTARIRKHYRTVELVSGGLLVAIGVLIFTGQLTVIVRYLQPYLPVF